MELDQIFTWPPTPTKWRALREILHSLRIIPGRNITVAKSSHGVIVNSRSYPDLQNYASCPFGAIVEWMDGITPKTGVQGGIVIAGDQTWFFDSLEVDLGTDGVWLLSLDCTVEVNRDDDHELLLPGVLTGTKPTVWTATAYTGTEDYPDGTPPDVATGEGTIILPIGRLTVAGGVASFENSGCGNFTIGHCAGTLSYART